MRVLPELLLQLAIARMLQATMRFFAMVMVSGVAASEPYRCAEIVADHAVHDEGAVHLAGSGEDFAARQVAPLVRADDAAGLEPFVTGIELCADIGACGGGGADSSGLASRGRARAGSADPRRESPRACPSSMICGVMLTMCAWRIRRRLTTSVICMRREQLVLLHLHGEDADLAGLHVGEHFGGMPVSGRGASSSRTKPFQAQPTSRARARSRPRSRSSPDQ